jgi:hypothetical protein
MGPSDTASVEWLIHPLTRVVLTPLRTSRTFVSLHQLAVDEDAIPLWPKTCEEKFSLLLDDDFVSFLNTHGELVSLGEAQRQHAKVFNSRLAVDFDFQIADELIESKIHLVLLIDADFETKLHLCLISTVALAR